MADVSVRFPLGEDGSEIILALSLAQAIRLMENIARHVGGQLSASQPVTGAAPIQQPRY